MHHPCQWSRCAPPGCADGGRAEPWPSGRPPLDGDAAKHATTPLSRKGVTLPIGARLLRRVHARDTLYLVRGGTPAWAWASPPSTPPGRRGATHLAPTMDANTRHRNTMCVLAIAEREGLQPHLGAGDVMYSDGYVPWLHRHGIPREGGGRARHELWLPFAATAATPSSVHLRTTRASTASGCPAADNTQGHPQDPRWARHRHTAPPTGEPHSHESHSHEQCTPLERPMDPSPLSQSYYVRGRPWIHHQKASLVWARHLYLVHAAAAAAEGGPLWPARSPVNNRQATSAVAARQDGRGRLHHPAAHAPSIIVEHDACDPHLLPLCWWLLTIVPPIGPVYRRARARPS